MCPFTVRVPRGFITLSGFSRELDYVRYRLRHAVVVLSAFGSGRGFAYAPRNLRPSTAYSVRRQDCHFSVSASLAASSTGLLTRSSIGIALRLILRTRLTLIRLALIRKPWSFGGEVSRLPYRYLYLHLLFRRLQPGLSRTFGAAGMLPYQPSLVPRLR